MRCVKSFRPILRNEVVKVGWRGKTAGTKKAKKMGNKVGNCTVYDEAKNTDVDDIFAKRGKSASE